jgi:hypothetical protein
MAIESGLAAQLMYAEESTWGTGVTPTRTLPFISEKIKRADDRVESKAIRPSRLLMDSNDRSVGKTKVGGQLMTELYDHQMGMFLKHLLGSVVTTGSGPYTHTFGIANKIGKGLTMQVGRPDNAGTVQPFTWAGCKFSKLALKMAVGATVTCAWDVTAKSQTTATALATASVPASLLPYTFTSGGVAVAGSAVPVKTAELTIENMFADDRYFLGASGGTISEQIDNGLMKVTGSITPEFSGLTQYARFTGLTQTALVFLLGIGTSTLSLTLNVEFDEDDTAVAGPDVLDEPVKFTALGTTDAAALAVVAVNADSTV